MHLSAALQAKTGDERDSETVFPKNLELLPVSSAVDGGEIRERFGPGFATGALIRPIDS